MDKVTNAATTSNQDQEGSVEAEEHAKVRRMIFTTRMNDRDGTKFLTIDLCALWYVRLMM